MRDSLTNRMNYLDRGRRAESRVVLVGWRTEGWAGYLERKMFAHYGAPACITSVEVSRPSALSQALLTPLEDELCCCWVIVRFNREELDSLGCWMASSRGRWGALNVAVVDVRWGEMESVVEAVRSLPRWPRLWLPPRDGSGNQALAGPTT